MSNTILISGASETLNVSVNPTLINVSVAIEEAAVTNTLEVNQFAGEYVSQLIAGDGIDISKVGTVSTISLVDDISSFETDPVFTASPAGSITSTQVSNWDIAYNDSITDISFNTDTGVLTATQTDSGELTTSLDGRYLQEETITSISFSENNLTYTDEDGTDTVIDLSAYLDNTNDFVTAASIDDSNVLTLSISNQDDVTVDLSLLRDNTNDYLDAVSLDEETGDITFEVGSQDDQTLNLDGRYLQISEFESNLGSITDQYLPKYDSVAGSFVDSKLYESTDKLTISKSNLDSTSAATVEFGEGGISESSLDGSLFVVELSRDTDVEYNKASAFFDSTDNKYYEVYQNSAFYFLPEYPNTPLNYLSISLAVYNNDGSKDFERVIFEDRNDYELLNETSPIKIGDQIIFNYTVNVISEGEQRTLLILYNITNDEASAAVAMPVIGNTNAPIVFGSYWSESLSKLFLLGSQRVYKYDIIDGVLVFDGVTTENISGLSQGMMFEHNGNLYITTNGRIYIYDESLNALGDIIVYIGGNIIPDGGEYTVYTGNVTARSVYIDGEVWSVSRAENAGLENEDISYLSYYSFADGEKHIIENLNPQYEPFEESDYQAIYCNEEQGIVYVDVSRNISVYKASTKEKLYTYSLNQDILLEAIGNYSFYGSDWNLGGQEIFVLGTQSSIPSSFSDNATVKLDLTYGDYTQIAGDSPVDPQSVLALIDQGLVYGAKSPTGVSHHFFSNTISTGDYERVLSIGPETLYVFNTAGENSTVTKTKIDKWDSAGPAIETSVFNTSTGDLTITLTDDSTVVANLDGRYLQTEENDFVTAASLDSNTLTLTVSNQDDVTVDLSSLVVTDNNDFLTTASFADGTLTLGVSNQSDVTVSLDGRYLQSETTTSLAFADNTLTYTDEEGTPTNINLSIYEETNTSLSFNTETSILTYTDEEGTPNAVDISSLEETLTSLSFSAETNALTYTDEDGTENVVSIDSLSETLTSLSYNGTDQTLTYTDEENNNTVLDISETVTSLSINGNILKYTDEDGTETDINLSLYLDDTNLARLIDGTLDSDTGIATFTRDDDTTFTVDFSALLDDTDTDTTYDLVSSANETDGADLNLTGSDSTTDTVNIIGTNAVTVTGAAGTITIDAPEETVTSLSYSNGQLTYTDENEANTVLNISELSGDTTYTVTATDNDTDGVDVNLVGSDSSTDTLTVVGSGDVTVTQSSDTITIDVPVGSNDFLDGATFNTNNGVLTLTVGNQSDVTVNLDDRYLTSAVDTNDYLTGASFNTSDGVLTLSVQNQSDVTVDLDNRYLTSYTDTDTTYDLSTKNNTTDGIDLDLTAGGDGSGTDTVTFKGANAVTVTQDSNVVTIDAPNGVNDFVDGATFNTADGVLTLSVGDQSDVTVDLDGRYLQSYTDTDTTYDLSTADNATAGVDLNLTAGGDGSGTDTVTFKGANAVTVTQASNVVTIDVPSGVNDFVDGASFNTADGVLTLSVSNQSDVTVDLDGRYLQSESDTLDSVTDRGNTTDNSIELLDGATLTVKANSNAAAASLGYIGDHLYISHLASSTTSATVIKSKYNGSRIIIGGNDASGSLVAQDAVNFYSGGGVFRFYEDPAAGTTTVSASDVFMGTLTVYRDLTVQDDASVGGDLEVTGSATFLGGFSNSSIRYKKNIQDLEDRTDDVMRLRPVRYELKSNDKKDIGLIAEEVEQIFPEVIGYKDGEVNGIDYAKLSVVFLQQIQKQQSLIDILEERITKLENK